MPFKVSYDAENNFILASIEGEIDIELVKEFTAEVVRISTAHNCRCLLGDLTKVVKKISLLDVIKIPSIAKNAGLRPDFLGAFVVAKDFAEFAFFETISQNQGLPAEIFRDIVEAKRWLATAGGK